MRLLWEGGEDKTPTFKLRIHVGPGLAPALANPAWRDWPYDSTPRVAAATCAGLTTQNRKSFCDVSPRALMEIRGSARPSQGRPEEATKCLRYRFQKSFIFFFFYNIPAFRAYLLCNQQHSRFGPTSSTAVLCFQ